MFRLWRQARLIGLVLLGPALVGCQTAAPTIPAGGVPAVKLHVTDSGFYRVSLRALQRTGLNAAELSPESIHLSQYGQPIPYLLDDDNLIFYGQAPESRYTAVRPYIVESGVAGQLMATTPLPDVAEPLPRLPQTLRLEENLVYISQARSADGDEPWYWATIQVAAALPIPFELPAVGDGSGAIRIRLWGASFDARTNPDHDLDLVVNGQTIATIVWDGETEHVAELSLPPGTLQAGRNELILDNTAPGAVLVDIMHLDWVELTYDSPATAVADRFQVRGSQGRLAVAGLSGEPFLFDIADPAAPQRLSGGRFADRLAEISVTGEMVVTAVGPQGFREPADITPLRRTGWREPANQADLLIVTTDDLAPALAPLVEARRAQGLSVAVVPVAEIDDTFGHGAAGPDSIQAFVAYAYENWAEPRPRYLFLVGDATSDYRGYVDPPPAQHVPTYMVNVNYSGETVSDARLADVNGDLRPDLAVGRWPVNDAREVARLVERTLAYEAGDTAARALFAADGTSDEFSTLTDSLVAESALPAEQVTVLAGPTSADVTRLWNEGAWLVTYTGHGSLNMWGKDAVFSADAIAGLAVAETPPIVVQLTCLSGLFAHPNRTSLSELLLLDENGPVLLVAATSLTVSTFQKPFAVGLLQGLHDPAVQRIGDALQLAKAGLDVKNDGLREISDTFGLLGDPSALIKRPSSTPMSHQPAGQSGS